MVVRGAAAYSPFHRSKTHLVYTTDDLRIGFVDRIHFFGRAHPENRAYALPIGKVGLGLRDLSETKSAPTRLPGRSASAGERIQCWRLERGTRSDFLEESLIIYDASRPVRAR